MRQRGTIEAVSDGIAVISVVRESACSGDCHKCAGCGAVTQTLQIRGINLIGAVKGDKVYVESSSGPVLWATALVYLVPILTFFLGYWLGSLSHRITLWSVVGFALGWIPALCYNAYVKKRPPTYTVVAYADRD